MKRDVRRALLGGAASALAWGLAERTDRIERQRRSQWAQAIQIWEGEGGRVSGRPTPATSISLSTSDRDDLYASVHTSPSTSE